MKYKVNKEELEILVKNSFSKSEVLRKMNLRPVGGNYKSLDLRLKKWEIDIKHFTGQGWNTGEKFRVIKPAIPLIEILIKNSTYSNNNELKKKLIKNNLLLNICNECKINSWNNKNIILELNHINGINDDNRIENLELLCPNCHSQTSNFRGRNVNPSNKSEARKKRYENYLKLTQNGHVTQ